MATTETTEAQDAVEIVKSFIETWNKHDTKATMAMLDPDVVFQSPLFHVTGVAARTEVNAGFMTSMPDFTYKLLRLAGDGDFVAAELLGTGTVTGVTKLPGRDPIPPNGAHVEFGMAGLFRVTPQGKIADERYYYDRMDLMQQLNPPSRS